MSAMSVEARPILVGIVLCVGMNGALAKDPELLSLSAEHFKDTASIQENTAEAATTISTETGFVRHTGLMHMVWNDEFLTATIDDGSGVASYRVHAWIIYSGTFRGYETASFQNGAELASAPVLSVGKEVANCAVGDCTYTEHVAFSVDAKLLRRLASERTADKPQLWHFKLIARSGPEFAGVLSTAEIAGLLARTDEYMKGGGIAGPRRVVLGKSEGSAVAPARRADASAAGVATGAASAAALERDFGVRALTAEAAPERPDRAGALVTAVVRGSTAQKAGLIVGDIVHEFAAQPIHTVQDLEEAVAAHAKDSQAVLGPAERPAPAGRLAVKLFRGAELMTVEVQ